MSFDHSTVLPIWYSLSDFIWFGFGKQFFFLRLALHTLRYSTPKGNGATHNKSFGASQTQTPLGLPTKPKHKKGPMTPGHNTVWLKGGIQFGLYNYLYIASIYIASIQKQTTKTQNLKHCNENHHLPQTCVTSTSPFEEIASFSRGVQNKPCVRHGHMPTALKTHKTSAHPNDSSESRRP